MNATRRNGFTVVELLIVSVLGALVIGVTYQVLVLNQRTYIAQNAKIESQQTVRAGLDVLFSELRELSTAESDILGFGTDTLTVRAVRSFGLACAVNVGAGALDVLRVGSWFEVGDSVVVYAENDDNTSTDDDWVYGAVTARDTTISCGTEQAQRLDRSRGHDRRCGTGHGAGGRQPEELFALHVWAVHARWRAIPGAEGRGRLTYRDGGAAP